MQVDLRGLGYPHYFLRLREAFSAHCVSCDGLEVLVDSSVSRKVRNFGIISGYGVEVEDRGGFCVLRFSGNPCRCR